MRDIEKKVIRYRVHVLQLLFLSNARVTRKEELKMINKTTKKIKLMPVMQVIIPQHIKVSPINVNIKLLIDKSLRGKE